MTERMTTDQLKAAVKQSKFRAKSNGRYGGKRHVPGEMNKTEQRYAESPIIIVIPGTPVSKPRMTQSDKWKKRPCVMRYRAWADKARSIVGELPPTDQIASLDWIAYFEPAVSLSAKKRAALIGHPHRNRPDRDNIDKAILDALFVNDSGIARGVIQKLWGESSRVEITITLEDSSLPDMGGVKIITERGSVTSRIPKHGKP